MCRYDILIFYFILIRNKQENKRNKETKGYVQHMFKVCAGMCNIYLKELRNKS